MRGGGRSLERKSTARDSSSVAPVTAPGELAPRHQRARAAAAMRREHARGHVGRAEHRRDAGAEDAGLLRTDELQRVAEPVAVIESDRDENRDVGIDEVGGVETAAETHLEHRGVDTPRRQRS